MLAILAIAESDYTDTQSRQLIEHWGEDPPAEYDIGPIFTPQLAANLLAVYPELIVTGGWSNKQFRLDPRMLSHTETASSHLVLTRFLLRLGVNARRFQLRVTEDADATTTTCRLLSTTSHTDATCRANSVRTTQSITSLANCPRSRRPTRSIPSGRTV